MRIPAGDDGQSSGASSAAARPESPRRFACWNSGTPSHLFEQSDRLGGVPERVLAQHRGIRARRRKSRRCFSRRSRPDACTSTSAPRSGRTFGCEDLLADHDAVLLAAGLWQERSLGSAHGVLGALAFSNRPSDPVPARVAILAGGDAAMDAARAAQNRGAKEIFIVFGGPRSALHWHLPESWFATPGVQAMMNWQPLGYEQDARALVRACGLRHAELQSRNRAAVDLVIEAMELQVAGHLREVLASRASACLHRRRAGRTAALPSSHCVAEGLAAAERHPPRHFLMKLQSRLKLAHGRCVDPAETIARLDALIRPHHDYWLHEETVAEHLHWTAMFIDGLDFRSMGKGRGPGLEHRGRAGRGRGMAHRTRNGRSCPATSARGSTKCADALPRVAGQARRHRHSCRSLSTSARSTKPIIGSMAFR